jgi:hypothetical protein
MSEPDLDLKPEYPAPPRVHWIVLLIAGILFLILDFRFVPKTAQGLVATVALYSWIIYLCIWIRRISSDSNCLYWAIFGLLFGSPYAYGFGPFLIILIAFLVRDELLEQYNQREPINLRLDTLMTFFFSFLYFQSYLYDIAQAKRPQKSVPVQTPARTLLP